ncbi:MAG: hypothetical protein U5L04_10040 [Trueperaceae bacterium]|nr:hypothetical protein [Trueperaceae bacterium]
MCGLPVCGRLARLLVFVGLLLGGFGLAINVEISTDPDDPTARLELRTVTLPDGSEAELYVVRGSPVTVTVDDDVVIADYIEFDPDNRLLRIVGAGSYTAGEEVIEGRDFSIDLAEDAFSVRDVLIVTGALDVVGVDANRIPGQIDVTDASFSPCNRCNQAVNDYGFRASELRLFPGDRLVAFNVTVLIRESPAFFLPLLVIPLGPTERQPRLSVQSGSEFERAEVGLDWPYVVGANALGFVSLRYYADVTPGEGNFFTRPLGGGIDRSYLGGGIDHTFYTDQGEGGLAFFYVPSFVDERRDGERTRDEISFRLGYATLDQLDIPQIDLFIDRDDSVRQRLVEYGLELSNETDGVRGRFLTQGFVDLDRGDPVRTPSYAGRGTPERTLARLTLNPSVDSYSVGPFTLSGLELDLGAFEDQSSPSTRTASRTTTAGRLAESHRVVLAPQSPWTGFSIEGITDFRGNYYSGGQRLIDWQTNLSALQRFGDVGSFSVALTRDVSEGETPFQFDAGPLRNRSDLASRLVLEPLPWLRFEADERYVFVDNRRPDEVGFGPLNNELTLFGNLSWLSVTLRESYDIKERDPGNLDANLSVRTSQRSQDVEAELNVEHTQDLKVTEDRLGVAASASRTGADASVGYRSYGALDIAAGYRYDPPEAAEGEPREFWEPLEVGVTLGTLAQNDTLPGARLSYVRDLNRGAVQEFGVELAARYDIVEASLEQRLNVEQGRLTRSDYRVSVLNIVGFKASGFALLPTGLIGLSLDEEARQQWRFTLRDLTRSSALWRLTYNTTRDPTLNTRAGEEGGFRDSRLELFLDTFNTPVTTGGVRFGVDINGTLVLADGLQPRTYLQRASLRLQSDFYARVGLQGQLSYRAALGADESLSQQVLSFDNFGLTVRPLDDLYISAFLNDSWDLTGDNPAQSPFNLQPTLYLVWDRCCWALYGSWDTETGTISIALSTPGGAQGLAQEFDTDLTLPGRGLGDTP